MDGKREEGPGVEANKPLLLSFLCAVIAIMKGHTEECSFTDRDKYHMIQLTYRKFF